MMICPKCNLRPLEPYYKGFIDEHGNEDQQIMYFSTCRECSPIKFHHVFFQNEDGVYQDQKTIDHYAKIQDEENFEKDGKKEPPDNKYLR